MLFIDASAIPGRRRGAPPVARLFEQPRCAPLGYTFLPAPNAAAAGMDPHPRPARPSRPRTSSDLTGSLATPHAGLLGPKGRGRVRMPPAEGVKQVRTLRM